MLVAFSLTHTHTHTHNNTAHIELVGSQSTGRGGSVSVVDGRRGKSGLPTVPGRQAGSGLQAEPRGTLCSFYLFIFSAGGRPGPPWPRVRAGRQGWREWMEDRVEGRWHNMSMSVKWCWNKLWLQREIC